MARVRAILGAAGYESVQTYIQSGNVLLTPGAGIPSARGAVAAHLATVLTDEFGFDIPVIVRSPAELAALVAEVATLPDPYPEGRSYLAFLDRPLPDAKRAVFDEWSAEREWARVVSAGDTVLYRLGVSAHEAKLTNARIERQGVVATSRDLRVVTELAARWS